MSSARSHRTRRSARMPAPIGQALRRLANLAVAASLGTVAGCSGDSGDSELGQSVPDGPWNLAACEHPGPDGIDDLNVLAGGVKLTRTLDHVSVYRSYAHGSGMGGAYPAGVELLGDMGTPCAKLLDDSACFQTIEDLSKPNPECDTDGKCLPFALTTSHDSVERIESLSEIRRLFGAIDTPAEAVIVALWNGLKPSCPDPIESLRGTEVRSNAQGYEVRSEWSNCGGPQFDQMISVPADGHASSLASQIIGTSGCIAGRRPAGLQAACASARGGGEFFAQMAHLEAASVFAFERLARELMQLGAPRGLIAGAASALLDELRHAQLTAALARRFGARPHAPCVQDRPLRSRWEIALENAVEGCVRESFGAIVTQHQAVTARDPLVARCMISIAADEARHAELAWHIARWLEPQLSAAERATLRDARGLALLALAHEAAAPALTPQEELLIGLPSARTSLQLIEHMGSALQLA